MSGEPMAHRRTLNPREAPPRNLEAEPPRS